MSSLDLSVALNNGQYERVFNAEIDCLSTTELLVRGQLSDGTYDIKHQWHLQTPEYEVLEARAVQIRGGFEPQLCRNYEDIRGVRIGRGFSKRIRECLGASEGWQAHLFLALEMARVGQQVYQFPPDFEMAIEAGLKISPGQKTAAHLAWTKDRTYMSDLSNSCYTYRDESEALFASREVRCGFTDEITRSRAGDRRVFWRNKRVTIVRGDSAFQCESHMQDTIHDIRVQYELGDDGVIRSATSEGKRFPYHGICEDAQLRTPHLVGLQVTEDFVRQFADHVGGSTGCTHLFDLSIDCLRLFTFA